MYPDEEIAQRNIRKKRENGGRTGPCTSTHLTERKVSLAEVRQENPKIKYKMQVARHCSNK